MEFMKIKDSKNPGSYLVLAQRDFDPAKHQLFDEARKGKDAGKGDKDLDTIASVNVDEAVALIEKATSAEQLDALEAAEEANPKKEGGRSSVLKAIEDRREALKP